MNEKQAKAPELLVNEAVLELLAEASEHPEYYTTTAREFRAGLTGSLLLVLGLLLEDVNYRSLGPCSTRGALRCLAGLALASERHMSIEH